ncbi:hypothetical protein GM415_04760 [Pseudodesulfovibrio cashew]|uniref:Lipoprotein n=1 Tax=Pseudodesulfovibrio cashew TaxID=2678688 RepID=A0A6I6JE61_9BACT|nr:hypothetical protein [Pseudodesulfovibrio cashew]QGY39459.1 hypothetical protein GM415_04760 [Pseudodesulfovibrio cashew]
MRTVFSLLLILLLLAACAGKEDVPADPAAENATAESGEAAPDSAADANAIVENITIGPVGDLQLADGNAMEITKLNKIGKYYIYISGKLNGRSSTVVSLTRLDDLQHWKKIIFQDQHTFTIVNSEDRELHFSDSRVYLGSDSADTYSFITTPAGSFQEEPATVKKKDVKVINIYQPTEKD